MNALPQNHGPVIDLMTSCTESSVNGLARGETIVIEGVVFQKLNQGRVLLVDESDWPDLCERTWTAWRHASGNTWYARHGQKRFIHQEILKPPAGYVVDHINHDGLDNRRCNIRIATQAENLRNRRRFRSNTSGVTGVSWNHYVNRWAARITINRRVISLGYYRDIESAASARRAAERRYFGRFAREGVARS